MYSVRRGGVKLDISMDGIITRHSCRAKGVVGGEGGVGAGMWEWPLENGSQAKFQG